MPSSAAIRTRIAKIPGLLTAVLVLAAILAVCLVAPREATMGDVQRIVYFHVAVAWLGLLALIVTAVCGAGFLARGNLAWDHWAAASAELGWLFCTLTLLTGSLWAHEAWGTWWTWEPRLTAMFVLWTIYCAYLTLRGQVDDPQRRARLGAVFAILGAIDVPLVVLATRWFRGMHPVSPSMEPRMRFVLLLSVVAFTALFCLLLVRRRAQLHVRHILARLTPEDSL
jgi:heme exporter protein C